MTKKWNDKAWFEQSADMLMVASSLIQTAMESLDQDKQAHQIVTIMRGIEMMVQVAADISEAAAQGFDEQVENLC